MAFQMPHRAANAGINSSGRIHHTEETTQEQYKHGDIDGIGNVTVGVVEPGCGCHQDINEPLGIRINGLVGARNCHFPTNLFIHGALVLPGRNKPGQRGHQNNQAEKNGVGGGESGSKVGFRVFWQFFVFSHDASPFVNRIVQTGSFREPQEAKHSLSG